MQSIKFRFIKVWKTSFCLVLLLVLLCINISCSCVVALLISYRILFSLAALTRWNLEIILNKRFISKNCKKLIRFSSVFFYTCVLSYIYRRICIFSIHECLSRMLKRSRLFERSFIDNWNWRDKVRQFLIKIFHQQYSFINIISNMSLFSLSFSLVNCEKKILLDFLLFLLLSRNKRFSTFKSSVYFFPPFKVPPLSVVKRSQSLLFARFFFYFFID